LHQLREEYNIAHSECVIQRCCGAQGAARTHNRTQLTYVFYSLAWTE